MSAVELPMVCTCKGDGIREVEERRLRIFHRMRLRDMRNLTDAIVLSLAFDFSADAEVGADMWFGVGLETPLVEDGLFIQCDDPSDGFAALWEWLAERFPDRVTASERASDAAWRAADRISEMLLTQCTHAEITYRKHRADAHGAANEYPPCEDCEVFMSLWTSAHVALNVEWGTRTLDECVDAALT